MLKSIRVRLVLDEVTWPKHLSASLRRSGWCGLRSPQQCYFFFGERPGAFMHFSNAALNSLFAFAIRSDISAGFAPTSTTRLNTLAQSSSSLTRASDVSLAADRRHLWA